MEVPCYSVIREIALEIVLSLGNSAFWLKIVKTVISVFEWNTHESHVKGRTLFFFFYTKANEYTKVQRNVIYFSFLTKIAFVYEVSSAILFDMIYLTTPT